MDVDAQVGDEVSVESHRLRGSRRTGTIVEILGAPGHEYYRVRWQDGRESVFHAGSDAVVIPRTPRPERRREEQAPPKAKAPAPRTAAKAKTPEPTPALRAAPGDRLVIHGHHLGERDRDAEVLDVGENGGPPFRVRWSDTGREALLFPGPDAVVEHFPAHAATAASETPGAGGA
jgi:hypothetical protein